MEFNVKRLVTGKDFFVVGTSYIGAPVSNTAMFVTKKVEHLINDLKEIRSCLIFAEEGIEVSSDILERNAFLFSKKPQLEYARFVNIFYEERLCEEKKINVIEKSHSIISSNAIIGKNSYIEPFCYIGPGVIIGDNAHLSAGTIIKHAIIGNNFKSSEYAIIGADGFTYAEDDTGIKIRIPTLGRVLIGDNVDIGERSNICCGSGGETIIKDGAKISSFVLIGHDDHIHSGVEITTSCAIGGFVEIGENTFLGMNSTVRNRVSIGRNVIVGMGSVVINTIQDGITVVGNPAKPLEKK